MEIEKNVYYDLKLNEDEIMALFNFIKSNQMEFLSEKEKDIIVDLYNRIREGIDD